MVNMEMVFFPFFFCQNFFGNFFWKKNFSLQKEFPKKLASAQEVARAGSAGVSDESRLVWTSLPITH
jgi:hypothetical protein